MTNVNYEQAKADQAAAQEKAQRDEVNARAWHQILNKYPLRDTQANYNLLLGWANPLSLEAFEALLRADPKSLVMISREQIIEDILEHSHGDQNTLRQLRTRLGTYSLTQLRQKRRDIDFKSEVHTKEQAKEFVSKNRVNDLGWNGTGFPKLQSTIVPPGQAQAVPTGQFLRQIAKSDFYLFKRYARMYSAEQLTYWMQQ
jgi:hypothetical protein